MKSPGILTAGCGALQERRHQRAKGSLGDEPRWVLDMGGNDGEDKGGGKGSGEDRRFLGVQEEDPHRPMGGSEWKPRRGDESPEGKTAGASHGEGETGEHGHVGTCGASEGGLVHGHGLREQRGLIKALILTTVILLVEAVGGVISGSLALLSDAGHMLTDASSLLLALFAIRLAARPKTPAKTFGWYRLEILAALANGVALVVLAGIIMREAIGRLQTVPEVDSAVMMAVATVGLAGNLGGLWFLHRDRHGSLNVRGAFLHILSDTLSSVAVLLGGGLIYLTGAYLIDPLLSMLISVIILIGAGRLVWEAVDVLLEATPAHIDHSEVASLIGSATDVCGVHDLHIWTITSGMYALSVHVVVPKDKIERSNEILREIKKLLLDRYRIDHTTVQIESPGYEHVGAIC
ncbi:MAG: cation diffusion facilitator family transporter [Myxococcota bacterium]